MCAQEVYTDDINVEIIGAPSLCGSKWVITDGSFNTLLYFSLSSLIHGQSQAP